MIIAVQMLRRWMFATEGFASDEMAGRVWAQIIDARHESDSVCFCTLRGFDLHCGISHVYLSNVGVVG